MRVERRHLLALLIVAAAAFAVLILTGKRPADPDATDARQYLLAGYNLATTGVFSQAGTAEPLPGLGREPGYGVVLAGLMRLDPGLAGFTPDCLTPARYCTALYASAQWLNAAFVVAAGLFVFFTARRLFGGVAVPWLAALHLWFNREAQNEMFYVISDFLALCLAALAAFTLTWAWRRGAVAWAAPAAALAALSLVKAVFLYVALPALALGLGVALVRRDRRALLAVAVAAVIYAVPVGGWMARNQAVGGTFALTEARGGVALSTREVFNHMTPPQYAAAFVYWTRGFGDGLARDLFDEATWAPFELYAPDGFYLRGQLGYGEMVEALIAREGLDEAAARARIDDDLIDAILERPLTHVATTLPLFWRGLWIDELIVISFPALLWLTVWAARRRRGDVLAALAVGWFSLVFYAAFSLNIPRYQLTALPTLALAFGWGVAGLWAWGTKKAARRAAARH